MKAVSLNKKLPINFLLSINNILEVYSTEITFSLVTEKHSDDETAQISQNISYLKVVTFLQSILNNSIVVCMDDPFMDTWSKLDNNVLVLPEVGDMVLLAALHCKLNSLMAEDSEVPSLQMRDVVEDVTFEYYCVDELEYIELPQDEEWCPELSYWSMPWWKRDDVVTFDKVASSQEKLQEWMASDTCSSIEEFSKDIFNEISNQFDKDQNGPCEVIEVDFTKKYKPKLVD